VKRGHDGITVTTDETDAVGIVDVMIISTWRCPSCRASWMKKGIESGQLKRCRRCSSKFFLRRQN